MLLFRAVLIFAVLLGPRAEAAPFFKDACGILFGHLLGEKEAAEPVSLKLNSGVTYDTIPLREKYVGENQVDASGFSADAPVRYFKDHTRQALEVGVDKDSLLRKVDGTVLNTCYPVTDECPAANFVMAGDGKIYVYDGEYFTENMELIFHSSILAGKPVASAGEIFVKDGKIILINDGSGHYHPSPEIFGQVVKELEQRGVHLENSQIKTGSWKTN